MKGCQTFEELQALGAEKIHERTHISRDKVELLLTKSYGEINKIQFMGFMSILEREYGLDMSEIREDYLQYQEEHPSTFAQQQSIFIQSSSPSKQKWVIAGFGLIVILVAAGYLLQTKMSNIPAEEVMKLNTTAVKVMDDPKELNLTEMVETNTSLKSVEAVPVKDHNDTQLEKFQSIHAGEGLEIRPVSKVWVGMINVSNQEKKQMVTKEAIKIDTSKEWLIMLGHGRVEIASSTGNEVLRERGAVWFVCEKGILKRVTKEEFTARNGGNTW